LSTLLFSKILINSSTCADVPIGGTLDAVKKLEEILGIDLRSPETVAKL